MPTSTSGITPAVPQNTSQRVQYFDTVLTGAGISISNPSNLPSGDTLARLAWEILVESLRGEPAGALVDDVFAKTVDRIAGSQANNREHEGLRLEQLLQILEPWYPEPLTPTAVGHDIDSPLLAIYETIGTDQWNFNHLALTRLGARNYTVNMDTLIESAGARDEVVHLHGEWRKPDTIISTVTRYLAGLSEESRNDLSRAFRGKSVLVMGYSGRDQDVMPLLAEFPPSRLTWVQYPDDPLAPEVIRMHDKLKDGGASVSVLSQSAEDFLSDTLGALDAQLSAYRDLARIRSSVAPAATTHARALVKSIDVRLRWLAFASVLYDLGLTTQLNAIIGELRWTGPLEIARKKIGARAKIRLGDPNGGLSMLLPKRPITVDQIVPYLKNANEIANILPTAGYPRMAEALDFALSHSNDLAPSAERGRAALQSRVRRGKHANVRGELSRALHHFDVVARNTEAWKQMGVGAEVDADTWRADTLKLRGRILDAKKSANNARERVDYANYSQRAWATWKVAELELVSAGPSERVNELLAEARSLGTLAGDIENHFWVDCTDAAAIGSTRPHEAFALLDEAEHMPRRGHGEGLLFLLIQRAELQRFHGDHEAAIETLYEMRRREASRRNLPFGCAPALLSGSLVLAKTRLGASVAGSAAHSAIRTLQRVRTTAKQRGFDLHAAHASTSITLASRAPTDPKTLEDYRGRGWLLEADRLENPAHGANDLWPVVM
jgi:SIR2-like domain